MWMKMRKIASPRNILFTIGSLAFFSVIYMFLEWESDDFNSYRKKGIHMMNTGYKCDTNRLVLNHQPIEFPENSQTRQKALLFLRSPQTQLGRDIVVLLESARFKFNAQVGEIKSLPVLIDDNKGRYGVIIFEDMLQYAGLHQWNRDMLDKYCRQFDIGIVSFLHPSRKNIPNRGTELFHQLDSFPIKYATNLKVKNYEVNTSSSILRITRPAEMIKDVLPNYWSVFEVGHKTYIPISTVELAGMNEIHDTGQSQQKNRIKARRLREADYSEGESKLFGGFDLEGLHNKKLVTVVQDTGEFDQVERVIFGGTLRFWLHKVLFLDALSFLSRGRLALPLDRNIQIDIDDMFVGVKGTRINSKDVMALLEFQDKLRQKIPDFSFQLGFSGKFIFSGSPEETEGDHLLLKLHDRFKWFPHMWSHMQAHWFDNTTSLCAYMDINRQFSVRHKLNMSQGYAVSPHHAGVYPVHQPLYDCWHKIWDITTTSTEEYPHLRPDHKRRGFIYDGVKVLPRQTCGLFTHTIELEKYPGGPGVLHGLIEGGLLFQSFLYNQFNIFMTHLSNYGNDRLGIYTFDRAIQFVQCWTNLKLRYDPPEEVARKYFELYPDEKYPLWTNPCSDRRHKEIYSEQKSCDRLPQFLVVGPQKTGTTALYWFLTMHPDVESNRPSEKTFEEVQFFSGSNYLKGIEWYMDFFPLPSNETILFEKSATYFDQDLAPKRVAALLPKAYVVVILIDPAKRAYSWYQHMRSHNDPAATKYTFYEVVQAKRQTSPSALISLQRRCLDPGFYAYHLERWTEGRSHKQIVVVDGEQLKEKPAEAMKYVQNALGFKKKINYNDILRFDSKKGFFCQLLPNKKLKCLGKSKGRSYPDMDEKSRIFLSKYYQGANTKLLRVLKTLNKPIPLWLQERMGR